MTFFAHSLHPILHQAQFNSALKYVVEVLFVKPRRSKIEFGAQMMILIARQRIVFLGVDSSSLFGIFIKILRSYNYRTYKYYAN